MKINKDELKKKLTPEQFEVTQNKATEPRFSGEYVNKSKDGMYTCVVCGNSLFSTEAQFESRDGWPSFSDVVEKGNVELKEDLSYGMVRTEIVCANCGAHLGHLFDDGPRDKGGLHYCVNSSALNFRPEKK